MSTSASPLAPGLRHSMSVQVTEAMTPPHLRSEPIRVFATPEMVKLVEQTAIQCVAPHLAPTQSTVGTRVDVAHLAATPEGMTVTATVELTAVDRRRLSFKVEVHDELDKVGEGTHERFIVDSEQRMPRLEAKMKAWREKKGTKS